MIFNHRFGIFLILAFALFIGVASAFLFVGCNGSSIGRTKVSLPIPATQMKQADQREAVYQQQIDSLKQRNAGLQDKLQSTKAALAASKHTAKSLEATVQAFLDAPAMSDEGDTIQALADCDTLRMEVGNLITANAEKDSLYDAAMGTLEHQVQNRDSVAAVRERQYADLRFSFNQSIEAQQYLLDESNFYRKQAKQQKVKSRVLSAALMMVSGFATYQLIQHSQ